MEKKKFANFRTARDIGTLGRRKRINGVTTRADKTDFFELDLSARSSFSIEPQRVRSNLRVRLFDGDRKRIGQTRFKAKGKNRKKPFERSELEAGTYYIQVRGNTKSGRDRFRLRLKANELESDPPTVDPPSIDPPIPDSTPTDDGDNPLFTASDLGVLTTTLSRNSTIGGDDTVDFYKFTLNDVANLDVRTEGASVRRFQLIRDENGNGLVDDGEVFAPTSSSFRPLDVPPGEYFIQLETFTFGSELENYTLTVVPTLFGGNVSPDPGNTLPLASNELGVFSGTRIFRDHVGTLDTDDFYKVTLEDLSNLKVTVSDSAQSTEVQLIRDDNNNGLIDDGEVYHSDGRSLGTSLNIDVPQGTYFINVRPDLNNVNTSYEMTVVSTPFGGDGLPDPGSTLSEARNLGTLTSTSSLKEYVGVLDSDDFYQFNLSNPANFQARLASSPSNVSLRMRLIQDVNSNGLIDNGEELTSISARSASRTLTEDLQAGTYFIQIEPNFTGNFSTNYDLDFVIM
ncbi:MAG: hypothetical protein AAGD25_33315 [Cyanobacteria bacterium P01_F01_bin.150]